MAIGAIGVIECVSQGSGMAAYEQPPRFKLGDKTRQSSTTWLAGSIVHDATHSKLYHDYKATHPDVNVDRNAWTGEQAEAKCLEIQMEAMKAIDAPQKEIDAISRGLETKYWEVPLEKRTW